MLTILVVGHRHVMWEDCAARRKRQLQLERRMVAKWLEMKREMNTTCHPAVFFETIHLQHLDFITDKLGAQNKEQRLDQLCYLCSPCSVFISILHSNQPV